MDTETRQLAERDHREKLEQAERHALYYESKRIEMHLDSTVDLLPYLDNADRFIGRGIAYAHKDFGAIVDAALEGREFAVVSGLNPSGPLHFGHKAMFDVLLWLQQTYGARVFIPITNDETYVVGKSQSVAESRRVAYEEVIPSIIALGFQPDLTHIFVHTDYLDLYKLAISVSRHTTYNNVRGLFGWSGSENPGVVFYMGALQFASILMPQLPEFGGPKPVLVPVGIDQHPYVSLARDVAHKLRVVPPSELIWKFLFGLKGPDSKMSSSAPDSAIFLTDTADDVVRKLRRAYSGGSAFAEIHREFGAVPDVCSVFAMATYNFMDQDEWLELRDSYAHGRIMSSELKKRVTELTVEFVEDHATRRIAAQESMSDFLLKTPITSVDLIEGNPFEQPTNEVP